MKYFLVLIFFAGMFLYACKNNSSEEQQASSVIPDDSTEILDTIFSNKDIAFLNQLRFSQYTGSQNAPINWNKFKMVTSSHDDSLLVSAFQPDKFFYEKYGRLLKYSPDSSMMIDLDSYNIEIQKDRKGQLTHIEKGPDTEVSLINLANKEKTRLVFLGPGNGIEEAGWIDNENVILIGYREMDTTKLKTAVIWRYHIPTKTFHLYESSDHVIAGQLSNWRKERLRQLLLQ